jgi:hypothetical protein
MAKKRKVTKPTGGHTPVSNLRAETAAQVVGKPVSAPPAEGVNPKTHTQAVSRQKNKDFRKAVEAVFDVLTDWTTAPQGMTPAFSPRNDTDVNDVRNDGGRGDRPLLHHTGFRHQ